MDEELQQQEQVQETPVQPPEKPQEAITPEGNATPQGQAKEQESTSEKRSPVRTPFRGASSVMDTSEYSLDDPFSIEGDLDSLFTDIQSVFRTKPAKSELSVMVSNILENGAGVQEVTDRDEQDMLLDTQNKKQADIKSVTQDRVNKSQTSEEVVQALLDGTEASKKPVSFADLRYNAVSKVAEIEDDRFKLAPRVIQEGMQASADIQKMEQGLWKESSLLASIADLGELTVPVLGFFEEGRAKAVGVPDDTSLKNWFVRGENVEDLAGHLADLPIDKRADAARALAKDILKQETALFENNNSFLTADQLQYLQENLEDGLQAYITEEDTGSERLETLFGFLDLGFEIAGAGFIKEGLSRLLRKSLPNTERAGALRSNRGQYEDSLNSEQPLKQRYKYSGTDEQGRAVYRQVLDNGMRKEDVIARNMPEIDEDGLTYSLFDPKAVDEDIQDISTRLLVDNSEDIVLREGKQVERSTGGTLKHVPSMTLWSEGAQRNSIGKFKLFFGDGDTGFETAEEARVAAKLGTGEELPVREINGRWYAEKDWEHTFDPREDISTMFDTDFISGNIFAGLYNPLRQLGSANVRDFWALTESARSQATRIIKPAQDATKKLSSQNLSRLNKLLSEGDSAQKVFTREEASALIGRQVSDNTWDAYKKVRQVFDFEYAVLNNRARTLMNNEGFKFIRNSSDENDGWFGRAVDRSAVDADEVYDAVTKATMKLDDVADDRVVVQLFNKSMIGGSKFKHVAVRQDDIKELPAQVVNRREGHVDRAYKDVKYRVVRKYKERVDGKEVDGTQVVGLTRLQGEADELLQALKTKKEYKDAELEVQPARENQDEDIGTLMETMQMRGYMPSSSKGRGTLLSGPNMNPARVANPLESMANAQFRVERNLTADVNAAMRTKFMRTFGDFLTNPDGYPRQGFLKFKEGTDDVVIRKAKRMYNYIESMNGVRKSRVAEAFESVMKTFEEQLFGATGMPAPAWAKKLIDADVQRAFMKLSVNAYIVGRPLFQIPTNLLQVLNVAVRYPINGSRAVARSFGMLAALASRNSPEFKPMLRALQKSTGYSDKQMDDLVDLIDETGIISTTGTVDDFLGQVGNGADVIDEQFGFVSRQLSATKRTAGKVLGSPLRASSAAQEKSIQYGNLVALIAEYDNALKAGKALTARTKSDILLRARKLTQTQNSLDQFAYQSPENVLGMMFQFVQHVNKLFLDIALEPVYRATTGKTLTNEASIFAETRPVAVRTALLTLGIFGMNGLPIGSGSARSITNDFREALLAQGIDIPADYWNAMQGGLINLLVSSGIDGRADVTARVSPSALVDMVKDMVIQADGSINVFGAVGTVTQSVFDIGTAWYTLGANPELDTADKVYGTLNETARFFSGFKDFERYWIAKNWMTNPFSSTLSGMTRITHDEAVLSLFSVNSDKQEDIYAESNFGGSNDDTMLDRVTEVMIREMNRELTELKQAGELDLRKVFDVQQKWVKAAKANVKAGQYDEVSKKFRIFMIEEGGSGFDDYIRPYIEAKSYEEQLDNLRRLRSNEEDPDRIRLFDFRIRSLEKIVEE